MKLINPNNFDLYGIFECGQAFRWDKVDKDSYVGIAQNTVVRACQKDRDVFIEAHDDNDLTERFKAYFDLDTDYDAIIRELKGIDEHLDAALEFGSGIRLLRQDPWELVISFIISANNNIPRIKNSIKRLSNSYGELITIEDGNSYYTFPTPQSLAEADLGHIRECGVGYRDKYIVKSGQQIVDGVVALEQLRNIPINEARKELTKLMGIGEKVADCILLFGLDHREAFPVDTWVKKILRDYYGVDASTNSKARAFANNKFGDLAGYAQQYLFHYIRHQK